MPRTALGAESSLQRGDRHMVYWVSHITGHNWGKICVSDENVTLVHVVYSSNKLFLLNILILRAISD